MQSSLIGLRHSYYLRLNVPLIYDITRVKRECSMSRDQVSMCKRITWTWLELKLVNHDQVSMLTYTCYVTRAAVIKLASALVLASGGNLVTTCVWPCASSVPAEFDGLHVFGFVRTGLTSWCLNSDVPISATFNTGFIFLLSIFKHQTRFIQSSGWDKFTLIGRLIALRKR